VFLKLSLRDFRNQPWFFLFFILNFGIGLTGLVTIDAFKEGTQASLRQNSKEYLSADMALSARRRLTEKEIQIAQNYFQEKQVTSIQEGQLLEFFTMAASGQSSRLVQLKAIDQTYPFYGKMFLRRGGIVSEGSEKEINSGKKAWVYPELLEQMKLKVGDKIKVGLLEFEISDVIEEDSTQTFRLASLAPKIYIGYRYAEETGLIQYGSTLSEVRLYKFESHEGSDVLKKELLARYEDPAVQVSSPSDAEEESGRVVGYLNDYLGLVSLVGLFLAMIGGAYLFRSYLNIKIRSMAIMNVLGLDFQKAFWLILFQLLVLSLFAALLSFGFSIFFIPFIQKLAGEFVTAKVQANLQVKSLFLILFISFLCTLFLSLPYLKALSRIQTAELLQETVRLNLPIRTSDYFYFFPLILFYFSLCIFLANSYKVGSLFFLTFAVSFGLLFLLVILSLRFFSFLTKFVGLSFRQAVLYVTRKRSNSVPAILSLSVAALLFNLIPQIKMGLLQEFQLQEGTKIPSLFLFDIQEDQVEKVKQVVTAEKLEISHLSPLVRARILFVNGQPFEKTMKDNIIFKTREEETEARFRNRGFNLSYRDRLSSSEKITAGTFPKDQFKSDGQKQPEISLEQKFSERLGLKIGDFLKFDVQGTEVEGVVTSLRSVKWNSFQPNFFVLFQHGVLEEAPKTWLASIGKMGQTQKNSLQNKITEAHPNISIIDVERVTSRILDLITKMSFVLQFMSFLSLMAGIFVIYSISKEQAQARRWDLNMNKILGLDAKGIIRQNIYESFLIGILSSTVGVLLSILVAAFLSYFIFEGIFLPDLFWPFLSIVVISSMTVFISVWTGYRVFRENPSVILLEG